MTAFEVAAVTSVRVCSGVAYLAAPGGPVLFESVVCTDDVILIAAALVLRGTEGL